MSGRSLRTVVFVAFVTLVLAPLSADPITGAVSIGSSDIAGEGGGLDPSLNSSEAGFFAPPANDVCSGAVVIPDGPYPILSAVTSGVDQATGAGDPIDSCSPNPVENGVWYRWTPSVSGQYTITTRAGATATTDGDGVMAVFTSTGGCGGTFTQLAGGCNDDACHPLGPSTISGLTFVGGTTYYLLLSHYPAASGGGPPILQYQV